VCDELKREELQFCCHTGAFSCPDTPPQPTTTLPIGGSRLNDADVLNALLRHALSEVE
jgi:hypothetical protein